MNQEWRLARNCSLSPRQVARAYALLCCASGAVAVAFLLRGVWIILAFSICELALVGLALLVYARHALDHERIALSDSALVVECVEAGEHRQSCLDPLRTRVLEHGGTRGRHALLRLESRGVQVEVGRFVTETRRRQVAAELRAALRSLSLMP
ncbi:DUF2244 domain-containing protein [Herbaspirillum sp. SJZ107]|uniref:DUF2244 domain-containing protein n=1 Tax=Herbaspirillum sp. SJZ107 TaxID=2572881 RepID=UPI0011512775|nr:DUF2244 domain-containing protein [Herbaspirillum sp. SJZ107]TQK11433.1 putative membrane protein [Herbaspirillum sp. SJZ107]